MIKYTLHMNNLNMPWYILFFLRAMMGGAKMHTI